MSSLNELRYLDAKIEYYTIKADAGELSIDDSYAFIKVKVIRELLILLRNFDRLDGCELSQEELVQFGGADGLRKHAKTLCELLKTMSDEEARLTENNESGDVIIKFDKSLREINERLRKV